MKSFYTRWILLPVSAFFIAQSLSAQSPPAGWNQATLKWDNRFYLITSGSYSGYVSSAMSQSQNFTLGTNSVNISYAGGLTTSGRSTAIYGTAGSFGTGASVAYNGNGTITLTLDTVVANLQFSLYDLDNLQTAYITAKDAAGTPLNITCSLANVGIITLKGTATNPIAYAGNSDAKSTVTTYSDVRGTLNVFINGFSPSGANGVKTVTITLSGTAGDIWLSDISAYVARSFTTNYFLPAKPWTGQPAYILNNGSAAAASSTEVASGKCRWVFNDQNSSMGNDYLNSLGYDCYKHILYYSYDGTSNPSTNKTIRKYEFNNLGGNNATMSSGTTSTLVADVTAAPFNVPVFSQGLESSAASFYDGSYYFGVEGYSSGKNGRYSMVWRLDFDASGNPTKATQAWAYPADNGSGRITHNWSDFSITNGVMYDFSSAGPSGDNSGQFTHCDLQSGLILATYTPNGNPVPGQSGSDWQNNIYWLNGSNPGSIALYNKNGTIGATTQFSGAGAIDWPMSRSTPTASGDGSDPFLPPLDYGDAPASFDPSSGDPASHDYDSTIMLGSYWNPEWTKKTTSDASGDGVTDDGLAIMPVYSNNQTSYTASVIVYNHSGANVILAGWIDMNNDGVFQASEGTTRTVASSTQRQTVMLSWSGSAIPPGVGTTFMRLRVTSASNGMTASNPTGYYGDGEVEDYKIPVSTVLQTRLLSFNAKAVNNQYVQVAWQTASETNMASYIIQRSDNGSTWTDMQDVLPLNAGDNSGVYSVNDPHPLPGTSYYRLKMISFAADVSYSTISPVTFVDGQIKFSVAPNPFKQTLSVILTLPEAGNASFRLIDMGGTQVYTTTLSGGKGANYLTVSNLPKLPPGIYIIEVSNGSFTARAKALRE